ncbi:MAG: glycosyltransferase [Candidatus Binatia bacterium]
MRLYLVNVDRWILPERALQLMAQQGHQMAGNWLEAPYRQGLDEFAPDAIVYAPHRQKKPTALRRIPATALERDVVKKVPTILWALYPDYLTGWDHANNYHADGFVQPVRELLPHFRARLVNSRFSKKLLEARAPGFTFEVCYLCIDTAAIGERAKGRQQSERARNVMWQHRWATDKNLPGALETILEVAPKHREVVFYLGRKEDWDEDFWVPKWLKDLYAARSSELERLPNVRFTERFATQGEYWDFLASVDIAFSCSYHETFGITVLEQACAGAACVVPDRVAYPEVHAGTLVVRPDEVAAGIESLLNDPATWKHVAASSKANAAKYTVERTVETLLRSIE